MGFVWGLGFDRTVVHANPNLFLDSNPKAHIPNPSRIHQMDHLERWRDEFPILARTVYMISNSLGAMPRRTADNLAEYAKTWATRGVRGWEERWWEMPIEDRKSVV